MVNISFEEQAATLKMVNAGWQPKWLKPSQIAAMKAAEKTLNELIVFRHSVQNLDPQDEQATNRVSSELLQLLKISLPAGAADALSE